MAVLRIPMEDHHRNSSSNMAILRILHSPIIDTILQAHSRHHHHHNSNNNSSSSSHSSSKTNNIHLKMVRNRSTSFHLPSNSSNKPRNNHSNKHSSSKLHRQCHPNPLRFKTISTPDNLNEQVQ